MSEKEDFDQLVQEGRNFRWFRYVVIFSLFVLLGQVLSWIYGMFI